MIRKRDNPWRRDDYVERLAASQRTKRSTRNSVGHDKWDAEDRDKMLEEMPPYSAAHGKLAEFVATGGPAMSDAFFSLFKAEPRQVDPGDMRADHALNHSVIGEMMGLEEYHRLRQFSVCDDVQAALSASALEEDLETLFDRQQQAQQKAKELQQAIQDILKAEDGLADAMQAGMDMDELIESMVAAMTGAPGGDGEAGDENGEGGDGPGGGSDDEEGDGEGEGEGSGPGKLPSEEDLAETQAQRDDIAEQVAKLQEQVDEAYEKAKQIAAEMGTEIEKQEPQTRQTLRVALHKAQNEAEGLQTASLAWGLSPGEMQRLPADERMALAKRLNNDRIRQIAERFGPIRNLMVTEEMRKTKKVNEEIYDLEMGDDIGRIIPSELLALSHPLLKLDFYRRFLERGLVQYALQGTEKVGRGGIVMCEDGSGSMHGDREMWAKAVMLCLIHLARKQGRTFHLIHFGGPGSFEIIAFERPEDFTIDRILDAAEIFYGGGTDFVTPMEQALGILQEQFARTGETRSDVVFITDDECMVPSEFMEEYLDEMHKMQSTTWGISVTNSERRPGALDSMTEGKVAQVKDFLSGEDIRTVFRGVV